MSGMARRTTVRPWSMSSAARWNSKRPTPGRARVEHHVGRVEREAGPRDPFLSDGERADHDPGDAGRAVGAALEEAASREDEPQRLRPATRQRCGGLGEVRGDGVELGDRRVLGRVVQGVAARQRSGEIDCDDVVRPEPATHGDRDGVRHRPIEQPVSIDQDRLEDSGQRVGGADRLDDVARAEAHLAARAELRRDRRERQVEILDAEPAEIAAETSPQPDPADESRAPEREIHHREDAAPVQPSRKMFQRIEPPGRMACADHRADRGAGDDVDGHALGCQLPYDPDMRPAERRAAAKRQPEATTGWRTARHRRGGHEMPGARGVKRPPTKAILLGRGEAAVVRQAASSTSEMPASSICNRR